MTGTGGPSDIGSGAVAGGRRTRTSGRARRRVVPAIVTALAAALLPAAVAASAGPATASPATVAAEPAGCTGAAPIGLIEDGYLLPAWSDAAGWTHPDQYRTITSGELDLDGAADHHTTPVLIGRNATAIEVFRWATPYGTGDKAYDPVPGHWVQVIPLATTPHLATQDGWWDPARYETIQLADIDGVPGDELVARNSSGIEVMRWDTANRTWSAPLVTPAMTDDLGWGQSHPQYFQTITTGQLDGRPGDEVIGRSRDGIEVWTLEPGATTLTLVPTSPAILTDAEGWNTGPAYWTTIRLLDVDGDGRDELVARSRDGLLLYGLDPTSRTWAPGPTLGDWADGTGYDRAGSYPTIDVGDVDGDGREDVFARGPSGIDVRRYTGSGWAPLAPPSGFTDADGYAEPAYGLTVQLADVLARPGLEVIGRTSAGVVTYALDGGAWTLQPGTITRFSDANGWSEHEEPPSDDSNVTPVPGDYRYATIQAVRARPGEPEVVIGRDATGVRTARADGSDPSAPFPAWTDLAGIPNSVATPLGDLDRLTPEGRAYWYVNAIASRQYWSFAGPDATILQQYRNLSNAGAWGGLQSALFSAKSGAGSGDATFDPGEGQLQAMNVPRATYNRVLQDVADWTGSVDQLHSHLLGPDGVKDIILRSFVANAGDVDAIKAAFETNPALVALLGDLLWGLIGIAGSVAFAVGAGEATVAIFAALGSVTGAGVAGGVGFYNPNAAIDTFGDSLKQELVDHFCAASRFMDQSFDQIVQDYGLLTANRELVQATDAHAPDADDTIGAMIEQQKLWIWQQFANRSSGYNFWVGWCDSRDATTDCPWDPSTPDTYSPPGHPTVTYHLIGELLDGSTGNCEYWITTEGTGGSDLRALIPPSGAPLIAPRRTDTGSTTGRPFGDDKVVPDNIGISGWHLGTKRCDVD